MPVRPFFVPWLVVSHPCPCVRRKDADMINANTTLNGLTYRELKELVPEAPGVKRTARQLEGEEVLFEEVVYGAKIRIFKNGYLTYTAYAEDGTPHSTAYSVHRCRQITFSVGFSEEERNEAWDYGALADAVTYRVVDGQLSRIHIIHEDRYLDGPWWRPISFICEERLRDNANSREEYRSEFSIDGDDEDEENWNPAFACDPINDWIEAEDKRNQDRKNHETLMAAMKSLTDIQRRTVDLFYSNPEATTRELGKEMGVDHSTFSRNLNAALKKLRKYF